MSSITNLHAPKGLEGVVATTSLLCYIDGEQGVLAYRGYDIHDLADPSTFEKVCYLPWCGRLLNAGELNALKQRVPYQREPHASITNLLQLAPQQALPMDVLRTVVS